MKFGEREVDLLEELWDGGEMTAADVQRRLQGRGIDLAFNSVQTMLGRLHDKGAVSRRLEGRTYFYKATARQQSVAGGAVKRLAARFFGGSRAELAAHLVQSGLKKEDLDRLQALIDEERHKGKKK
jgi:BlaI family transcriptional regulator, penicillinase repressor